MIKMLSDSEFLERTARIEKLSHELHEECKAVPGMAFGFAFMCPKPNGGDGRLIAIVDAGSDLQFSPSSMLMVKTAIDEGIAKTAQSYDWADRIKQDL